ncbi:hypothetical protein BOSE62_160229 [Bosea sp. 62]|nr:hypothetical protein BOSE46_10085 [Bosea sp. 46]CAD5248681.1 hypothetical protein BOSE21B_10291 [Bosea sp. 21B]CAD5267429.1 hypothetical protein BOSE7B_150845 [Bosea sp. 7B]VVT45376.1 hypothetical protein BOS5A_10785 [Bosea sp. EC-HK365B]VXA95773.1 hypothetical protein BOSE29B_10085 [Bosea sp. 29B]VXA96576.1 hypothetical protein BOSE125_10085 [Bosea sp. 125]VXB93676.1 hypothetical protein BOSE62_160229 [Bosea sp. 62]VXC56266.1 hypothetical protein BOSE127_190472 [Bosea sp. 127]
MTGIIVCMTCTPSLSNQVAPLKVNATSLH